MVMMIPVDGVAVKLPKQKTVGATLFIFLSLLEARSFLHLKVPCLRHLFNRSLLDVKSRVVGDTKIGWKKGLDISK